MAYACVVIGASLGGLEAVATLLRSLGPDFSAPVAIAQHRTAAYSDGDLSAIWQRSTSLVIRDAEDKEVIERHRIYVAPADYHLLIESPDQVALSTDPPVLHARPSIDVLFERAAEVFADKLIGVILTGASADGSQGLKAIRERGGCALVQDPATAECAVMPRSAIAATSVNHVLPLPDLGRLLTALAATAALGAAR